MDNESRSGGLVSRCTRANRFPASFLRRRACDACSALYYNYEHPRRHYCLPGRDPPAELSRLVAGLRKFRWHLAAWTESERAPEMARDYCGPSNLQEGAGAG